MEETLEETVELINVLAFQNSQDCLSCLSYALRFWNRNNTYKIYYNSDHCINIPSKFNKHIDALGFLPIEEFGYEYFQSWFQQKLITKEDLVLLDRYFQIDSK